MWPGFNVSPQNEAVIKYVPSLVNHTRGCVLFAVFVFLKKKKEFSTTELMMSHMRAHVTHTV